MIVDACLLNMDYVGFEYLPGREASEKRFILLKMQNMMDIKKVLLQWFINFLIRGPVCLHGKRP